MALNEKNDKTKKVIHLLVTSLCDRDCKYCCNKQLNLSDIPQVTDEELRESETVCLTGGEPFAYTQPWNIAHKLKIEHPNIKRVYIYTNSTEFARYLSNNNEGCYRADGYNISIKTRQDYQYFKHRLIEQLCLLNKGFRNHKGYDLSNRLYLQTNIDSETIEQARRIGFEVIQRPWQKEFKPCDDSIFRRI